MHRGRVEYYNPSKRSNRKFAQLFFLFHSPSVVIFYLEEEREEEDARKNRRKKKKDSKEGEMRERISSKCPLDRVGPGY